MILKYLQLFPGLRVREVIISLFLSVYLIGNRMETKFKKSNRLGFPGSETWRSAKHVLAKAKTSSSSSTGFVILFAVTISAIILAIALGITNVAFKEVRFSTDARDTNDAFFAADTGAERALFLDKGNGCTPLECSFTISGLGSTGQSCVVVTFSENGALTTIISKGYNDGGTDCIQGPNSVERVLIITIN